MSISIMVVVGTRPEIIKMSSIIREILNDPDLTLTFVHSGQHYDFELSKNFIEELELPTPDIDLHVGSGSHAYQTSQLLEKIESVILEQKPDVVLAEGDTNTVMATGLASVKLHVPFGHVEAGIRSYDRQMPEEINRKVAAVCAELHFAPTERAASNLLHEGVIPNKVFITGNTIVDACLQNIEIAKRKSNIFEKLGLELGEPYALVTVHRQENVDNRQNLKRVVEILLSLKDCELIFSVHPRTKKMLELSGLMNSLERSRNIIISPPFGYLDFLKLLSHSAFILTDSGGIQEEALTLNIPCLTMRDNTERPATLKIGANKLVNLDQQLIEKNTKGILSSEYIFNFSPNPYGDGTAGKKIVQITKSACLQGLTVPSSSFKIAGSGSYKLLKIKKEWVGKTIVEINNENNILIMILYDNLGNCYFPRPDTRVLEGWNLLVFGEFL